MIRALAFLSSPQPLDYAARLGRLRWSRAARPDSVLEWGADTRAAEALALAPGAEAFVVVRDVSALPLGDVPRLGSGTVLRAGAAAPPAVHTLRELEASPVPEASQREGAPAIAFRREDVSPGETETVAAFLDRLEARARSEPAFRAVVFEDASERERPELTRHLPDGSLRILDAGCGAGGGIGLARRRHPGWEVVGVERDPRLAARARERCDRVLEGDLMSVLRDLEVRRERFGALVFADVLEHLEDPVEALTQARRLAAPGALLLVSVPNAGHLSIARDLLLGRHDAVAAGLCDAGHLRWFTRTSLSEAIAEAGWRLESLEGEPGPAPDAAAFQELAAAWPDADAASLATYQWIATARPA